ncbi:hypothetical protein [Candidatus Magnetominusculus xianensis]|uniref:Uncharacterized protein n=1 Tax=Candidatus Magnetominusculus xianensis TaxID=1748249 RepID=A0ABR5SEF4_9BACT|nr:hypothetical protein [Candidatus Magnetominusculus xianensis]KWT81137.1 hypothetical protein ASN18_2643 [Candidatus Magnetominusculus xianensis]MBF0402967.1 hypothetical protein [Nitrospirota bacterium]
MLQAADIKFYHSDKAANDGTCGGRMNELSQIVSGVKYAVFPAVTSDQRASGAGIFRKIHMANRNGETPPEPAYNARFAIVGDSNGGDRFYAKSGGYADIKSTLDTSTGWTGGGALHASMSAGATMIQIAFPANDYDVPNNRYLAIMDTSNRCWVKTADEAVTGESAGTGEANYSVSLVSAPVDEGTLKVHYTIGGNTYMAVDDGSGAVTGVNITSGSINYNTGLLTLQFNNQADDVTCDYAQRCFSFSGNVATVKLGEQVPYSFNSADTTAGVAVELGDLEASLSVMQKTSAAGGFSVGACVLKNTGAAYDEITIMFTSGTAFSAAGLYEGSLGNGTINGTYAPLNKRTSVPLFSIPASAWSGVWASGDVLEIRLIPAAKAVWIKNIIPAGTGHTAINTLKTLWHVD